MWLSHPYQQQQGFSCPAWGCPPTPLRGPEAMCTHCPAEQRSRLVFPPHLAWKRCFVLGSHAFPLLLCVAGETADSMEGRPAAWRQASKNALAGGLLGYCRAPSLCSGKHFPGNHQASCFGFSSSFWLLVRLERLHI